eukprot:TRINITY_DN5169_c0_g2_i1.p1 TRINITY_DN5169_c0_g2~~TRINITY_DN5169_c0_g2_i1.p1  ORF type:complete len:1390 (+),score=225.79 TRINITY_DN5169_c0_g2_i1:191-4360(+)
MGETAKDIKVSQVESRSDEISKLFSSQKAETEVAITKDQDVITPVKGQRQCTLLARSNFELEFCIHLTRTSSTAGSVIHICSEGDASTCLPHIFITGDSPKLSVTLCNRGSTSTIHGPSIPLHRDIRVCVEVSATTCKLVFDGHSTVLELRDFVVPLTKPMWVYISSPTMSAAQCRVFNVKIGGFSSNKTVYREVTLELPPSEKKLLDEAEAVIAKNKESVMFDAFFGAFLILNCVCIAVQLDLIGDESTTQQQEYSKIFGFTEIGFTVVFVVEFCLRIYYKIVKRDQQRSMWATLSDRWMVFDAVIITSSLIDGVTNFLPFNANVVRIIRFCRLAKLLRLMRAFRELAILVEGVLQSLQTLFWTFLLLLITTYAGAILCIQLCEVVLQDVGDFREADLHEVFASFDVASGTGSLPSAMVKLLSMATFDGWTEPVRFALRAQNSSGYLLAFAFLGVVLVAGVGILNIVLGVMAFTTFRLDAKMRRVHYAENFKAQQSSLIAFRTKLREYGERPLFKSQDTISATELLEAATSDESIRFELATLGISPQEVSLLVKQFYDGGDLEIDGVVEAIGSLALQRYSVAVSTDFFGRSSMGTLQPSDMLFFSFGLKRLQSLLQDTANDANIVCSLAYDIVSSLHMLSYEAYTVLKPKPSCALREPRKQNESKLLSAEEMAKFGVRTNTIIAETSLCAPLDVTFAAVTVLNGIYTGVSGTTTISESKFLWLLDIFFAILFTAELSLRLTLFVNIEIALGNKRSEISVDDDDNEFTSVDVMTAETLDRLIELRGRMRFQGLVPPVPPGGWREVLRWTFAFLNRNGFNLFDFIVLVLYILDVLLLRFLPIADISVFSLFKLVRLLRLSKVFRTFGLLPQLQMLFLALHHSFQSIITILVLLILTLFVFGIITTVQFGRNQETPMFNNILNSMLTGWQLITFDGWGVIITKTFESGNIVMGILLMVFMFFFGFGLMKMTIGIMCGSSVSLNRTRELDARRREIVGFYSAMGDFQDLADSILGTRVIAQEIFEAAVGIKIQSRKVPVSSSQLISTDNFSFSLAVGKCSAVKVALFRIFERAKLTAAEVKQVFEKTDHGRTGFVTIDAFLQSALVLKEDLGKVDIFANSIALANLRRSLSQTNERIRGCFVAVEDVIEDVNALIQRKPREVFEIGVPSDMKTVRHTTLDALDQLGEIRRDREVGGTGRCHVHLGEGKISFNGNVCSGKATNFVETVEEGDVIVWGSASKGEGEGSAAAVVVSILSCDKLIVNKTNLSIMKPVAFVIMRTQYTGVGASSPGKPAASRSTLPPKMSPRHAQQFLEWDVNTRKEDMQPHLRLEREKDLLFLEAEQLEKELMELNNRGVALKAWRGLKMNWRTWKESNMPPRRLRERLDSDEDTV